MALIKQNGLSHIGRPEESYVGVSRETSSFDGHEGLIEYWRLVWLRKWTIVSVAFLCGVLGLVVALVTTPVYSARTTLEIQDVNPGSTSVTVSPGMNQAYSALSDIQTQVRILESESMAARTVDKLLNGGFQTKSASTETKSSSSDFSVQSSAALRRLLVATAKSMKVREIGATRIIEIVVESTDRQLAAAFANKVSKEFIDQSMESRWAMSQQTGNWLGHELGDMKANLERSEYALQAYAQKSGLLFANAADTGDGKTNVSGQKLSQIQAALSLASTDRVAKESKYRIAQSGAQEGIPEIMNDPALRDYETRTADLKRQIAELSAIYTPDFAKVRRLQSQLDSLDAASSKQRLAVVDKIKNEFDEAVMREKLLTSEYENQAKMVGSDAEKGIQYSLLKREVDSNRMLYETMLQRVKESRVNAALKSSNIQVIDAALVPLVPTRPNKILDVAMGLFLGSLLGLAFVVVRDKTDSSVRIPGDAPRWLNVPELGVFPRGSLRVSMRGLNPPASLEASSSMGAVLASIMFANQRGRSPRVIVFTSSNPSEGKTTVAANIAVKCSEIGKRVLLIDSDFARPHVHEMFGLPNTPGFSKLMQAEVLPDSDLGLYIHEVSPGLFVLPSGAPADTTNLLFSGRVADVLLRLKRMYDMILIDTPPTPQFSHARILGRIADGVVLITRSGKTSRETALATIQRLSEDRSHVLGTILNDWNASASPAGNYWQQGSRAYLRWESPDGLQSIEQNPT